MSEHDSFPEPRPPRPARTRPERFSDEPTKFSSEIEARISAIASPKAEPPQSPQSPASYLAFPAGYELPKKSEHVSQDLEAPVETNSDNLSQLSSHASNLPQKASHASGQTTSRPILVSDTPRNFVHDSGELSPRSNCASKVSLKSSFILGDNSPTSSHASPGHTRQWGNRPLAFTYVNESPHVSSKNKKYSTRKHPPASIANSRFSSVSRRSSISRSVSIAVKQPGPWLRRRICSNYGIYILYTLSFLSAALDAASFTAWTAFLNMQTGNTIFVALGASEQPANNPFAWITALGSLISFTIASHLFGLLAKRLKVKTRLSLSVSFGLQALLTFIAAALIQSEFIPIPEGLDSPALNADKPEPRELAAIIPLAFAAAGQVVATRELGFPLIPTVVLTTIYADAFRDTRLLKKGKQKSDNHMRSKMLITIVVFFLGGLAGGWIARSESGMGVVVWVVAGWRLIVSILWAFWPWDEDPNDIWWDSPFAHSGSEISDDGTLTNSPDEEMQRGRPPPLTQKRSITWTENHEAEKEKLDLLRQQASEFVDANKEQPKKEQPKREEGGVEGALARTNAELEAQVITPSSKAIEARSHEKFQD